jgi:hypothetical protein
MSEAMVDEIEGIGLTDVLLGQLHVFLRIPLRFVCRITLGFLIDGATAVFYVALIVLFLLFSSGYLLFPFICGFFRHVQGDVFATDHDSGKAVVGLTFVYHYTLVQLGLLRVASERSSTGLTFAFVLQMMRTQRKWKIRTTADLLIWKRNSDTLHTEIEKLWAPLQLLALACTGIAFLLKAYLATASFSPSVAFFRLSNEDQDRDEYEDELAAIATGSYVMLSLATFVFDFLMLKVVMAMQNIDTTFQKNVYQKLEHAQLKIVAISDASDKEKAKETKNDATAPVTTDAITLAIHIGHVINYLKRHRYGFHFFSIALTARKIKVLQAAALSSTLFLLGIVAQMLLSEALVEQIKHYIFMLFRVVS